MEIDTVTAGVGEIVSEACRVWEKTSRPGDGRVGWTSLRIKTSMIRGIAADDRIVVTRNEEYGASVLRNRIQDVAEGLTDRDCTLGCEVQDGDDGIVGAVVVECVRATCAVGHGEVAGW